MSDESAPIVRSHIWYSDGSVMLQAKNKQFRVHWSILSQHSHFFRDLQCLPQPVDDAKIEGCYIVEMHDMPEDVEELLKLLYRVVLAEEPSYPFNTLSALLRLSCKYEFREVQRLVTERLIAFCPITLQGYEKLFFDEPGAAKDGVGADQYPLSMYFDIVSLARETSTFSLLPCALFRIIVQCSLDEIFAATQAEFRGGSLPASDLHTVIKGRDKLIRAQWDRDKTFGFLFYDYKSCSGDCPQRREKIWRAVVTREDNFAYSMSPEAADFVSLSSCFACITNAPKKLAQGRQKLWDDLPSFFGLPPWSELLANSE